MAGLVYNTDTLDPMLEALRQALEDPSEAMADLGELLVASTQDRMQRGENPDGTPFAPRAQSTLKRYAKLGLAFGAPLNQSGDMRNTLFYEADKDGLEYGSNAIQAAVMQFGAKKGAFGSYEGAGFGGTSPTVSIPWGDIPAREFIGISDDDQANMVLELEEWLQNAADSRD